jgi:hypothetical protein
MPEVFVDVDLVKALITYYILGRESFHRKDRSIFFPLDKETLIEVFNLGGPISLPIDIEILNENFKSHKNLYMGRVMTTHIPMERNEKGKYQKKRKWMNPCLLSSSRGI